jgi:predicted HAD superfamily phosphohydrolase
MNKKRVTMVITGTKKREMIYYKTEAEIELIRQSALLVGNAIADVAKMLKARNNHR